MKIVCPRCDETLEIEEKRRITCEHCGISFSLEEGEKALERKFALFKSKAYKYFLRGEYITSNEFYKEALSLKENDFVAITKYSLNMIYGSNLNESKFKDVFDFIDTHDIELDSDNTYIFLDFMGNYFSLIDLYLKEKDRLISDNIFYNLDYFKSYIKTLNDILYGLNYFKEAIPLTKEEDYQKYLLDNNNPEDLIKNYEFTISEAITKTYNVNKLGDIKIEQGNLIYLNENIKNLNEEEISDLKLVRLQKKKNLFERIKDRI